MQEQRNGQGSAGLTASGLRATGLLLRLGRGGDHGLHSVPARASSVERIAAKGMGGGRGSRGGVVQGWPGWTILMSGRLRERPGWTGVRCGAGAVRIACLVWLGMRERQMVRVCEPWFSCHFTVLVPQRCNNDAAASMQDAVHSSPWGAQIPDPTVFGRLDALPPVLYSPVLSTAGVDVLALALPGERWIADPVVLWIWIFE